MYWVVGTFICGIHPGQKLSVTLYTFTYTYNLTQLSPNTYDLIFLKFSKSQRDIFSTASYASIFEFFEWFVSS